MIAREGARPSEAMARSHILLIDDNLENLGLLERMLEWCGYANVTSCTNGRQGLEVLNAVKPDLIILDLMMPGMDGYEFLAHVRADTPLGSYVPILVFTADLTPEAKVRALELGASDFLTKPGDAIEIQLRVRNFLRMRKMHSELEDQNLLLEARVRQRTEHLAVARIEAMELLARTCEFRDDDTGQHANRVGIVSAEIARILGHDSEFVDAMRLAAPLHDLGKIAIPDSVLFKPDKLTDDEFTLMKRHPGIGAELLSGKVSPLLQLAHDIARYHHEWWDGNGYEAGLAGDQIPIAARIVSVADAFDAMTNDRPYREARPVPQALIELRAMAGIQFDPAVVEAIHQYVRESVTKGRVAA